MNRLAIDKRSAVISALVEGSSINASCRMTGIAKSTMDSGVSPFALLVKEYLLHFKIGVCQC